MHQDLFEGFSYDTIGEADHRTDPFDDRLYLINEHGRILGARTGHDGFLPGTDLFAQLTPLPGELSRFSHSLADYICRSYLLQTTGGPLLISRAFYPATRTLLCMLPPPAVAKALISSGSALAAYDDEIELSPFFLGGGRIREDDVALATDWVLSRHRALLFEGAESTDELHARFVILHRVCVLSAMCGIAVSYDFSGIGFGPIPVPDWRFLTGTLLALLLLARRCTRRHDLSLYADRDADGRPCVHALLTLLHPENAAEELTRLAGMAAARGIAFSVCCEGAERIHIRFGFCPEDRTAQGMRNPFTAADGVEPLLSF